MIIDDPVVAAEQAAASASVAAEDAVGAAVAVAADQQPNPDALIAADVAIATEQEATARARIDANAAVRIAELQQEEPPWLNDIRACLTRMETMLAAMANPQPSIPAPSVVIIPDQPIPEEANPGASEGGHAEAEAAPEAAIEPAEVPAAEPAPAPARRGHRWI